LSVVLIFTRLLPQSVLKKQSFTKRKICIQIDFTQRPSWWLLLNWTKTNRDIQQLPFCGTLCGLNYIILINCSNNTYHIYFIIRRFRYSYSKARCTETMNRAFLLTIQTKLGIYQNYYTILATSCDWNPALLICWFFVDLFIFIYLFI